MFLLLLSRLPFHSYILPLSCFDIKEESRSGPTLVIEGIELGVLVAKWPTEVVLAWARTICFSLIPAFWNCKLNPEPEFGLAKAVLANLVPHWRRCKLLICDDFIEHQPLVGEECVRLRHANISRNHILMRSWLLHNLPNILHPLALNVPTWSKLFLQRERYRLSEVNQASREMVLARRWMDPCILDHILWQEHLLADCYLSRSMRESAG